MTSEIKAVKEGWVYCISNESMPGLLKIGMTDRTPQQRLAESNKTDTWRPPTNFVIEFAKKVKGALQKEKTIHKLLEGYNERVNRSREFFKIDVKKARLYFDLMDGEMWEPPIETKREPEAKKATKGETTKGGYHKKPKDAEENPTNSVEHIKKPNKKEINAEINEIMAEKRMDNYETMFNANIKDIGIEESRKLITTAFDKASLDIRVGKTYYTFDKLTKIQAKQIKNKIFTAVISSPTHSDMHITMLNIDSVINQIECKTDSTFILLDELCKM